MLDWRDFYKTAVLETNPKLIERWIGEAEAAIFLRQQELAPLSDGAVERQEMAEAAKVLLRLKIEKLGWPNPASKPPLC